MNKQRICCWPTSQRRLHEADNTLVPSAPQQTSHTTFVLPSIFFKAMKLQEVSWKPLSWKKGVEKLRAAQHFIAQRPLNCPWYFCLKMVKDTDYLKFLVPAPVQDTARVACSLCTLGSPRVWWQQEKMRWLISAMPCEAPLDKTWVQALPEGEVCYPLLPALLRPK